MTEERTKLLWDVTFNTKDPNTSLLGTPVPVMTSLLHRVCDNDEVKFTEVDRLIALLLNAALDKREEQLKNSWRCFHCDEVFTDQESAKLHFGPHQECSPICQIGARTYRLMEEELQSYRSESDAQSKTLYELGAAHHQKLAECAQTNYDKGLADGRNPHMDEVFTALKTAVKVAEEARQEWDLAPPGMKAGKLLCALSGMLPNYRPDITAIHTAIANYEGILGTETKALPAGLLHGKPATIEQIAEALVAVTTPYGDVTGPKSAAEYVRELVADDTTPKPTNEGPVWRTGEGMEGRMSPEAQGRILNLSFRIGYPGSRTSDLLLETDDPKKPMVLQIPNEVIRKHYP